MSDQAKAPGSVTSGIEPVQAEGARQRAILSRAAAVAFIAVGTIIIVEIPGLALVWALALVSLVMLIGIMAMYIDSQTSPAYRQDHLAFSVTIPANGDPAEAGGNESAAFLDRVFRSVKDHLNRNRISNTGADGPSGPMKMQRGSRALRLDSWMAELKVVPGNAPGRQLCANIVVGPLTPATDGTIRKMMEALRAELEKELGRK